MGTSEKEHTFFDRLFPRGFAGADVLAAIAPDGWEQSSLLACFQPAVEQLFAERLAIHRNLEHLRRLGRGRDGTAALDPRPEPTLEDVRREYEPSPVNEEEEVTELVGLCLWDIFSHNHEVIAADGRLADIGSFRGAGAFLDEYLTRDQAGGEDGDYMRFYMGTIWISRRADLTPVYAMIFRRLQAANADWVYHFPEIGLVELARRDDVDDAAGTMPSVPACTRSVISGPRALEGTPTRHSNHRLGGSDGARQSPSAAEASRRGAVSPFNPSSFGSRSSLCGLHHRHPARRCFGRRRL